MRERDFSTHPRRSRLTRVQQAALGGGVVALVLSTHTAWEAWGDYREARGSLEQARGQAEAGRARAQALEGSRGTDEVAQQALLTAEAPPPRILTELGLLLPGDVRLEALSLTYGRRLHVEMRVAARRAVSYDLFLDRLEQSPLFSEVVPGDEGREGEVRATIRARFRGTGL